MEYLMTPDNLKTLVRFSNNSALLAFDYDGTLAPIVDDPERAGMRSITESLFYQLCSLRPVAIISGRSLKDMKKNLKERPKYIIGNHGAEWEGFEDDVAKIEGSISVIKKTIEERLLPHQDLGISIEDKEYSLSLHYRSTLRLQETISFLNDLTSELSGLARIIPGKYVFNILPLNSSDKYVALMRIMEKEKATYGIYFGDDDTDEDVFKNLNPQVLTVKVGWNETSKARYFLKDQIEIDQILTILINGKKSAVYL